MTNETKRECFLWLALLCFGIGTLTFFYEIAFHWEPFWLQLKRYWPHVVSSAALGFLFLGVRKEIPKKTKLFKITLGEIYARRKINSQKRRRIFRG